MGLGSSLNSAAAVFTPRSRWASEEWARGSYSFVAVGASGKEYDQLAAPVSCSATLLAWQWAAHKAFAAAVAELLARSGL